MTFVAIGTHGHMKCVFDGHLKSQDTVLMNLYKRMFPKWTYNPTVLNPPPMLESLQSMATEPSAYQLFDDWVCCFNWLQTINRNIFMWCVLFINSWKAKYLAKHGGNEKGCWMGLFFNLRPELLNIGTYIVYTVLMNWLILFFVLNWKQI